LLPAFLTDPVGTAWVGLQVYWARNPADFVSGETITYQYDALKRLVSANSTPVNGSSPPAWTQSYRYDGFGNLTAKVLNGNTTTIPVTAATNQLSSASYDVNGNMISGAGAGLAYDEANRISGASPTGGGSIAYGYDAANKQIYRNVVKWRQQHGVVDFMARNGRSWGCIACLRQCSSARIVAGTISVRGFYTFQPISADIWFAGSLIWEGGSDGTGGTAGYPVWSDRLGTNRLYGARFYPYGDEITSTPNDHEKFATYTRDSYTGLDYADQRYYASSYGRFNTPDPSAASAGPSDPGSWNRYSYTGGDPVNRLDAHGLWYQWADAETAEQDLFDDGGGGVCTQFLNSVDSTIDAEYDPCFTLGGPVYYQPQKPPQPPGGGASPTPNPASPDCPPNISNFLSTMVPLANQLANRWQSSANDILALSAYESGWLGAHAQSLQNPYGLTQAGGNDLSFNSYQDATNFWSKNDGHYIKDITDISKFAAAIQPHYNAINPAWASTLAKVYRSVLKWRSICDK
jgi:RHS repeat-associated protein